MPVPDRLDLTLRLVRGSGRLTLAELATRLGVSEMTVRRDLDQLQDQGLVRRVRGGAVALDVPAEQAGFAVRERWLSAAKAQVGRAAAALIEPGSTVLLDAGTTTSEVAAFLPARAPLTVAVLSLQAAARLADQPGIRLLVIGGESRAGERSLVGPLALAALDQLRFDTFVMSIGAIHHDLGFSEFDLDDAAVKRAALGRAGRTVVAADSTKLGVQAFARVAPLAAVSALVTDVPATVLAAVAAPAGGGGAEAGVRPPAVGGGAPVGGGGAQAAVRPPAAGGGAPAGGGGAQAAVRPPAVGGGAPVGGGGAYAAVRPPAAGGDAPAAARPAPPDLPPGLSEFSDISPEGRDTLAALRAAGVQIVSAGGASE